jgi:Relaxase/Mobilisation nuclease domain
VITKVSAKRGDRMRGLVEYLFGPGKRNEHTDQRVIAAYDEGLLGEHPGEFDRGMVAAELDHTRRWYAPETNSEFVYHVSISNPAEDRDLTDAEWREVAETAAKRLGFGEPHSDHGVRWIAVHHGKSMTGNDHIHLVANMIREDGSKHWFPEPDFTALRHVAKDMEARFGLSDRTAPVGAGTPALSRVEVERQQQTGMESDREVVRRSVRAAATAASTETEFLGLARLNGLILRPHWAKGGTTTVTGFSAARPSKQTGTDSLVFFSGTRLGRDLTLPALRAGWIPEADTAPEWRAVEARRTPGPARTPVSDPSLMKEASDALAAVHQRLGSIPLQDRQAWSALARDGAGVLAAMAQDMPDRRVKLPLTQAAHALASAAWREPRRHIERPPDDGGLWKAAQAVLTVGGAQAEVYGTLILIRQMMQLAEAISDKHEAAGRLGQARWAAQAAERGLAAMEVIRATPGRAWAAQLEPAAKNRTRRTAAELAREFGAGPSSTTPTTGLPPRTRRGPDSEPHRDDREYGR